MPDNSSIAYQIYRTIVEKQNDQIKKGTILKADIIDISEEDFIQSLQRDVMNQISDDNLIDQVYREILGTVKKTDSIRTLFDGSKINLASTIIIDSITAAKKKQQENVIVRGNEVVVGILIYNKFMQLKTVEEQMSYYESLSTEEQREFRSQLFKNVFGPEMGKQIYEAQEQKEKLLNSDAFKNAGEAERAKTIRVFNQYNPLKYIFENLGFNFDNITSTTDIVKLTTLFSKIYEFESNSNKNDQTEQLLQWNSEFLKKLGITDIKEYAKVISEKIKKAKDISKLQEILKKNRNQIEKAEVELKKILNLSLGENFVNNMTSEELESIFIMTIDSESGYIDPTLATYFIQEFAKEHEIKFDEAKFDKNVFHQNELLIKLKNARDFNEGPTLSDVDIDTHFTDKIDKEAKPLGNFAIPKSLEGFGNSDNLSGIQELSGPSLDDLDGFDDFDDLESDGASIFRGFQELKMGLHREENPGQKIDDKVIDGLMLSGETIDISAIKDAELTTGDLDHEIGKTEEKNGDIVISIAPNAIAAGKIAKAAIGMAIQREVTTDVLNTLIPKDLVRISQKNIQDRDEDIGYSD